MVITMNEDNRLYDMCSCNHQGGSSPNGGQHIAHFQEGHGHCKVCDCKQFTWVYFSDINGKPLNDKEIKRRHNWQLKGEV